jgi:S-formylglutathione hydrolase FrmB
MGHRAFRWGRRRALLAACAVVAAAPAAASGSTLQTIDLPDRAGEIPQRWLPYPGPPRANVLLPDNYNPEQAYPLVLLLHGFGDDYQGWSAPSQGDIAATAAGLGAIVVMPEGGRGWYTDWWNGGQRGAPAWESYMLDEVLPQVLERYRIRPERRYHAIVGVSMGGLGAAYLGGRLPGYFGSVAVLSGFVDPQRPLLPDLMSLVAGGWFGDVEGPADGFYATGHNPSRVAANLAHTRVFVTAGDGTPSALGYADLSELLVGGVEEAALLRPMSDTYAAALQAEGVDVTYQPTAGLHGWTYFRDELRRSIAWGLFGDVPERPSRWRNDTVATHGELWDVRYRFDAPPDAIARFSRDGDLLRITGPSTGVTVTTAGGCELHAVPPAELVLPAAGCAVSVAPAP